jgi:hypothetical protein
LPPRQEKNENIENQSIGAGWKNQLIFLMTAGLPKYDLGNHKSSGKNDAGAGDCQNGLWKYFPRIRGKKADEGNDEHRQKHSQSKPTGGVSEKILA